MQSFQTYTFPVLDAPGVDPRSLELPSPLSLEALIAAIDQAIPDSPPCVDDPVMCPGLVPDDGSSQRYATHYHSCCTNTSQIKFHCCSSNSPPCTPQTYDYPSPSPQLVHDDPGSLYSPIMSPAFSAARVLTVAPCAGGKPIKQKGGYSCPVCGYLFQHRDDAKRHMDTTGMKVTCKYCGKPSSARRDGRKRHLAQNKSCIKVWEAGFRAGRFTERTVGDAYN